MTFTEISRILANFEFRPERKLLLGWLILACGLTTSCQGDKELVGGYRLTWMNGCEVRIARSETAPVASEMIAGSVQSYAVRGPYITGYADTRCIDTALEPRARPGYFLIDTRVQGSLQLMTEEDWK